MTKCFFDKDASLSYVKEKTIAIIGYGNQGRSQALNMRDSGLNIVIGCLDDDSQTTAVQDNFPIYSIAEASSIADIIVFLIPDEVIPDVFRNLETELEEGCMLVFASGFNIYYKLIEPPNFVDIILLAPRMIGTGVRENFINGRGFPSLIAVEQNASGFALERGLGLAKGIGSTKRGVFLSSFEEETILDLFLEHLGGLYAVRRRFEVLVEAGLNPEIILLELYASGEGVATAKAVSELGLWEQLKLHSRTSQFGQEITAKLSIDDDIRSKKNLHKIVDNIRNGNFAKDWIAEKNSGYQRLSAIREENLDHYLIKVERNLFNILGRNGKG